MSRVAAAGAALPAAAPVIWNFLGYHFEAGPLVVAVCATLMTRLIVAMNTTGRRRLGLDISVTMLSVLVAAIWVQSNQLSLLPAGISGIFFGAMGVGIIGFAKSQALSAIRTGLRAAFKSLDGPPPPPPAA